MNIKIFVFFVIFSMIWLLCIKIKPIHNKLINNYDTIYVKNIMYSLEDSILFVYYKNKIFKIYKSNIIINYSDTNKIILSNNIFSNPTIIGFFLNKNNNINKY